MLSYTDILEPVIKWSGSKRSIAPIASTLLPPAKRYIEPFVGGGSMLPFRTSRTAVAGDEIVELIDLWMMIRDNPELTAKEYQARWNRMQQEGYTAYYVIRDSFNSTRNPHDLLFLSRTCVNGLIRFNKNREFNNSLHHMRPGIAPERLRKIIFQWSRAVQGVQFVAADYRETLAYVQRGDVVFLDPPYAGTKGRYIPQEFKFNEFYNELRRLNMIGAKWILTLDGTAGSRTYDAIISPDIYNVRLAIPTGNSPFTKLMRTGVDPVRESMYLNFEPSTEMFGQFVQFRK